jgi:hypothetical protein
MKKKLFIAATRQNDGKTTVALGLILNLMNVFPKIGFIKPIGQRYLFEEGYKVDEDSVLMEKVCNFPISLKDLNPIAVESGFTEKYILNPNPQDLTKQIKSSFEHVASYSDLIIIEGTGHAGVGSVFDHSNAYVAKLLDAKVLLISSGGIGRPIDEIVLNKSLFDKKKSNFLGVIINKVLKKKYERISDIVKNGLRRKGINTLGIIPYEKILSSPTMEKVSGELKLDFIAGEENKSNLIKKIVVGAMEPHEALDYIEEGSLVITPGDREDLILTAIGAHMIGKGSSQNIAGLLLSGGLVPHKKILEMIKRQAIPTLIAPQDTYIVASKLHDLTIKIRPEDKDKIELIKEIVREYVEIDKIIESL